MLASKRQTRSCHEGVMREGEAVDSKHAVRYAAQGPQAANVVGITNQTDLFHTFARALGLK
jgi:alkaline phosphatase